jgi:hypothetical protein
MKRLQILIDEDLDAELERAAHREGRSKGALVRESLRKQLRPLPPIEEDPIWRLAGRWSFDPVPPEAIDEVVYGLSGHPVGSPDRGAPRAARPRR